VKLQFISALAAATALQAVQAAEIPDTTPFALGLYQTLAAERPAANLFFSPYSISTALAMTYAGAHGQTATEMAATLQFDRPQSEVAAAFAALEQRLTGIGEDGKVTLHTANSLWYQRDYRFREEFLETGRKKFKAEIAGLDFIKDTEDSRQKINRWVADRTSDKIPALLAPGVLDPLSRMVLCNAIYFKGDWATQFDAKATHPADFFVAAGQSVKVPMMAQKTRIRHATPDGLSIVALPYQGGQLTMVVLLPDAKEGLEALEARLNSTNLTTWLGALDGAREKDVAVELPKFNLNSQLELKPALSAMGMPTAFGPQSDFSGMDGTHDLQLNAVVHQAVVEVNEQGTEAAAATAAVVGLRSARPPSTTFRADHPFLFLIRDQESGAILFLGRVLNPLG